MMKLNYFKLSHLFCFGKNTFHVKYCFTCKIFLMFDFKKYFPVKKLYIKYLFMVMVVKKVVVRGR